MIQSMNKSSDASINNTFGFLGVSGKIGGFNQGIKQTALYGEEKFWNFFKKFKFENGGKPYINT